MIVNTTYLHFIHIHSMGHRTRLTFRCEWNSDGLLFASRTRIFRLDFFTGRHSTMMGSQEQGSRVHHQVIRVQFKFAVEVSHGHKWELCGWRSKQLTILLQPTRYTMLLGPLVRHSVQISMHFHSILFNRKFDSFLFRNVFSTEKRTQQANRMSLFYSSFLSSFVSFFFR